MVARMFCRSLSWMGCVGLVAALAPLPELTVGVGVAAGAAAGAAGVVVVLVEDVVDDGVTAAD